MNENKNNDWIVASIMNPQNTLGDFIQQGVTPENTVLKDRDYYENNEDIKKLFSDEKGKFKKEDFDKFYDISVNTYNDFAKDNFDKSLLNDSYYYDWTFTKPKGAKLLTETGNFTRVKNPFKMKTGIADINTRTSSGLSTRELAQQNEVKDLNGNGLGWTPNDDNKRGFFDFWKSPTVALAQWDEDGEHYDPFEGRNVQHKKNDYKLNEDGNFFYEELGDREHYGKTVLNVFDTATVDGSFANKFDFMDSDGLDKSIGGIIAKTAAQTLPYFIPGFGTVYGAAQIGIALADVLPMLAKSTAGLFLNDSQKNEDWFKGLSSIQSFSKRFNSNSSDYAKSSMVNAENLLGMVGDIFGQLYQQKAIAAIPQKLGYTAKEAKLLKEVGEQYGTNIISKIKSELDLATDIVEKERILSKYLYNPQLRNAYESYSKLSNGFAKGLSSAYMAAISSTGIVEEAKAMGLNERDTGALLLGTTAGLFGLTNFTEVGHWALKGLGLDDAANLARTTIKQEGALLREMINKADDVLLNKNIAKESVASSRLQRIFDSAKTFGKTIGDKLTNGASGSMLDKAMMEAVEETSEEVIQDLVKGAYNGLNALGLVSTDKAPGFEFSPTDMFQRYAMSFFGGALGGAIFDMHDKLLAKTTNSVDNETNKDLFYQIRNGNKNALLKAVDRAEKSGTLGNKDLSPILHESSNNLTDEAIFKPAEKYEQSQNAIVANLLRGQINYLDNIIRQENIPSDDSIEAAYEARYGTAVDLKLNTSIRDDVQSLTNNIVNKVNEIKALPEPSKDASQFDVNSYKTQVNKLNQELQDYKTELAEIASGNRYDKYYQEALFNMNKAFHGSFGVKDKNDLAIAKYNKPFWNLEEAQKQEVEEEYKVYSDYDKRIQLRVAKQSFDRLHEVTNKIIPELNDYAIQKQGFINKYVDLDHTYDKLGVDENTVDTINVETVGLDTFQGIHADSATVDFYLDILSNQKYLHLDISNKILNHLSSWKLTNSTQDPMQSLYDVLNENDMELLVDDLFDPFSAVSDTVDFSKLNTITLNNIDEVIEELQEDVKSNKDRIDQTASIPNAANSLIKALSIYKEKVMQNDPYFAEGLQKLESLKSIIKSKQHSPLYKFLKENIIEVEGASTTNVIDILETEFQTLEDKQNASRYILENNIKYDQLEQAREKLAQINSVLAASTNFSHSEEPLGYNNAINTVREKNKEGDILNVLNTDQYITLKNELALLDRKLEFLTNLSRINESNKVRNLKVGSGVMRSLFVESIKPESDNYKILKDAGVDLTEVDKAFADASNFNLWVNTIRDPENKTTLPSADRDILNLELETARIERAIFDAVNKDPEKKLSLLKSIISKFDKARLVETMYEKTNFGHDAKSISYYDSFMYLNMIMNVDNAAFLNDFRGEQVDGKFELELSKYAPFFGQEYSLKMAYWLMQTQNEEVNTVNLASNYLAVPEVLETDKDKAIFNKRFYKTLYNTIFINGIPGSGKTTSALNYLMNIGKKYGYTAAVYGPYQEQGERLKESLGDSEIIVNDNKNVKSLLTSIIPSGLYTKITEALKDNSWQEINVDKANGVYPPADTDASLLFIVDKSREGYDIRLNHKHPEIAKFFAGEMTSSIVVDGKTPDMIVIDESTHLSIIDLELLGKAIELHNSKNSNKISLFLTGDTEQRGFTLNLQKYGGIKNLNINTFNVLKTPVLSTSLRTGYNIKSNNINRIRAYRQLYDNLLNKNATSAEIQKFLDSEEITLDYSENDNVLIGDKLVDYIDKPSIDQLVQLSKNSKIGVIVSNVNGDLAKLIKSYPNWETIFDLKTPERVQGLEYDYVIIDSDPIKTNARNQYDAVRALEMLYTMTTRSKVGSLIKDTIVSGIKLESTDKDVFPVVTKLDEGILNRYKDFRLDSINNVLNELGSSQFAQTKIVKTEPVDLKDAKYSTKEDAQALVEVVSEAIKEIDADKDQIIPTTTIGKVGANGNDPTNNFDNLDAQPSSTEIKSPIESTETPKVISDAERDEPKEDAFKYDDRKLNTYAFHYRLSAKVDNPTVVDTKYDRKGNLVDGRIVAGKIADVLENKDLDVFYRLLHNESPSGKAFESKEVQDAIKAMRTFRNAIYAYSLHIRDSRRPVNLKEYFTRYVNLPATVINSLDFDSIQFGVESKMYSKAYDQNYNHIKDSNYRGIGHFVAIRIKSVTGTPLTITLGAFPNKFNKEVANKKPVIETMEMIDALYTSERRKNGNKGDFVLFTKIKEGLNFYDVIRPATNMIVRSGESIPLTKFREEYPHLKISQVHIMTNPGLFKDSEQVDTAIKNFVRGENNKDGTINTYNYNFVGRPVILASYDPTKNPSILSDVYYDQYTASITDKLNNLKSKDIGDDVKLIPLDTVGLDLQTWIGKNIEIIKDIKDKDNLDSKVQANAYGNKFMAAKILNSLYTFKTVADKHLSNDNYDALRNLLNLPNASDEELRKNVGRLSEMLNVVFQVLGYSGSSMKIEAANKEKLSKIIKDYYSELATKNADGDYSNEAYRAALEHVNTKAILAELSNITDPNGFVEGSANVRTLRDADNNPLFLDFKFSEPFTVLVALRTALEGGSIAKPNSTARIYFDGVFPKLSTLDTTKGKADFYNFLNNIIKRDFPKGIFINPVIKKSANEGLSTNAMPMYPAGNPDSHFTINAKLTEFNGLLDIDALDFRTTEVIENEEKSIRERVAKDKFSIKTNIRSLGDNVVNKTTISKIEEMLSDIGLDENNDISVLKNLPSKQEIYERIKSIIDSDLGYNRLIRFVTDGQYSFVDDIVVDIANAERPLNVSLKALKNITDEVKVTIAERLGLNPDSVIINNLGISNDKPINFIAQNSETNEKIATFVFDKGAIKNLNVLTPQELIEGTQNQSVNDIVDLADKLQGAVHDFIQDDVIEFYDLLRTAIANGMQDSSVNLKLGVKYLMISSSLKSNGNQDLLNQFNNLYTKMIETYKC